MAQAPSKQTAGVGLAGRGCAGNNGAVETKKGTFMTSALLVRLQGCVACM